MLAWIRGGEGEMMAERRATHTHAEQWARSLSIVYGRGRSLIAHAYCYIRPRAIQLDL